MTALKATGLFAFMLFLAWGTVFEPRIVAAFGFLLLWFACYALVGSCERKDGGTHSGGGR